jgi:hypothetical protein
MILEMILSKLDTWLFKKQQVLLTGLKQISSPNKAQTSDIR